MPWGTIDDRFYDHDKVLAIPVRMRNEAVGLYWRAISYCNAKLTDGVIPEPIVAHLDGTPAAAAALVTAKLWHRRRGGYVVHDFLDGYNRSRAEVEAGHRKKAEAGRLGGKKSGEARRKQPASTVEAPASPPVPGRLNSPSESESVSVTPQPPAGGGRSSRAQGTSPRQIAAAAETASAAEASARQWRRQQRQLAYYRGAITESERVEMDRLDAPLSEIPEVMVG